ncbi:hypothetical protein B0J11DRAFT_514642 [Dendryphion nanum]|uniref:F-box domain-containing protein n=1 Tax=Dendryphion nanum TaxID=256645 RepID=A0A9P9EK19_9PLEO|nr:hypothetical protein B0J11DRAFT_514642 [Dendryphion nanum]
MRLHDLPDDILIPILSSCDIDSFFAARLVSRSLRAVTDSYVRVIAPGVARSTFPNATSLPQRPENGYSLRWLRDLIPAHLASIILDKDKLRRHCYSNAGFPYGIPCEYEGPEAVHWRRRVANGWSMLRSFYLISRDVYSKTLEELEREEGAGTPKYLRKMSGGVRSSRMWQAVSCPYQGCTEHGVKRIFGQEKRKRRESGPELPCKDAHEGDYVEAARRRESLVLKRRLQLLGRMKDDEVMDYVYLWRLLLWLFRPYRKPDTSDVDATEDDVPQVNWKAEISGILHGCSWLNWFVLHVGTTPFWQQWWAEPTANEGTHNLTIKENLVRNMVWTTWNQRSHHQIELEREFISKFEFALRKRCLSVDRLKRLEEEIFRGRVVKTISLDCIPWEYDRPSIIARPVEDFPWHRPGQWVWLTRDVWVVNKTQGRSLVVVQGDVTSDDESEDYIEKLAKGPLERVPYLVYLGVDTGENVWGATSGNGAQLTL